nr:MULTISPECIES: arginine--tRNA ligase [Mycolicibacterium]
MATASSASIGDWGTPFGMLIEHLVDEAGTDAVADFTVGDLDAFYKQARLKFDDDESFKARARERERVVKLQGRRDSQTTALWSVLVAESTRHFNEPYAKLGILLTDDDLAGESTYQFLMPDVLTRLERGTRRPDRDRGRPR